MNTISIIEQDLLVPVPFEIVHRNSPMDPSPSNSDSSSPPASSSEKPSNSRHLTPRNFVWGEKVIRNALPCKMLPAWLNPLRVDINDPTELPLCWYGIPFFPDMVFAYAQRIRVAVYMKYPNLSMGLKVGDFDAYGTWPRLVKWFEDQSGLTMHLQQVWGQPRSILTFFNNHEIPRVMEKKQWELIEVLLSEIGYPVECKVKWHLDRRLDY